MRLLLVKLGYFITLCHACASVCCPKHKGIRCTGHIRVRGMEIMYSSICEHIPFASVRLYVLITVRTCFLATKRLFSKLSLPNICFCTLSRTGVDWLEPRSTLSRVLQLYIFSCVHIYLLQKLDLFKSLACISPCQHTSQGLFGKMSCIVHIFLLANVGLCVLTKMQLF